MNYIVTYPQLFKTWKAVFDEQTRLQSDWSLVAGWMTIYMVFAETDHPFFDEYFIEFRTIAFRRLERIEGGVNEWNYKV